MTGQEFGSLSVVDCAGTYNSRRKWNCRCKCGKLVQVTTGHLRSGHTTSCGCAKGQSSIIDRTGMRFGRLIVESCFGKHDGKIKWNCKCDCGNSTIVPGGALVSGNTTSCGCVKKDVSKRKCVNLVGKRFSRLLVLSRVERKKHHTYYWLCACDCGNKLEVSGVNLVTGGSKSCGCLRKEATTKHGLSGDHKLYRQYLWKQDPSRKLRHRVSCTIRHVLNGRKSGSCFDYLPYTPQQLKEHLENQFEPWMSWDNYGGLADAGEKTWWIDHIKPQSQFSFNSMTDSEFQECWALNNLRPLEKISNIVKGNKT